MKGKHLILSIAVSMLLGSCGQKEAVETLIPISEKALSDTSSRFYADFASYPAEVSKLPIGVFDSGTGGLTVQEKFLTLDEYDNVTGELKPDGIPDFAGEDFVYLADDANMPYGDYDAAGKSDYLRELVVKDALFLMGDSYYNLAIDDRPYGSKPRVKIIVIACNTATAYGLGDIEKLLERSNTGVKVIGVINAGVRATLEGLDKKGNYSIGVMATPGTISSGAYERTISQMAKEQGFEGNITVYNQPALGFANAVDGVEDYVKPGLKKPRKGYRGPVIGKDEGCIDLSIMERYNFDYNDGGVLYSIKNGICDTVQINSAANYARFHLVSLVEKHRKSGNKTPLTHIILGCTHYPYLMDELQETVTFLRHYKKDGEYIYKNLISKDLRFVDPAQYTAMECYNTLRKDGELALRTEKSELLPFISIPAYALSTENLDANGDLSYDFKYGRVVGTEDLTTVVVPFSSRYIDEATISRMERLVPASYNMFKDRL